MANMVSSPYGPVPGCPNNPRCEHAGLAHDVWDDHDPLPQCGFYDDSGDCPCGRPPAGYRRAFDQRVWRKGDRVPVHTPVLAPGGTVIKMFDDHHPDWLNTEHDWLIEVELDDEFDEPAQDLDDAESFEFPPPVD